MRPRWASGTWKPVSTIFSGLSRRASMKSASRIPLAVSTTRPSTSTDHPYSQLMPGCVDSGALARPSISCVGVTARLS